MDLVSDVRHLFCHFRQEPVIEQGLVLSVVFRERDHEAQSDAWYLPPCGAEGHGGSE